MRIFFRRRGEAALQGKGEKIPAASARAQQDR